MEGTLSPADVAVLSGNNRNGNGDGWGDNGAWWIILFLIFGWGRNGFGGNNGGGIADNYVLASDFANISRQIDSASATLERKGDAINNGLCDGFYAMNTGMLNGFASTQQTLCQGFNGINTAILQSANATERGFAGLSNQLSNCCCDLKSGLQEVNYNNAMNTNALQNTLCNTTRDIIESNNANYRALHDEIIANRIEDKNAQIQAQQNEINALRLSASQERQNAYLLSELKPCPTPAYVVPNPNCCYTYGCGNNTII